MEVTAEQVFTPTVSAVFAFEGRTVRWIQRVTTIEAGHPILKGREHMVEPMRIDFPIVRDDEGEPVKPKRTRTKAA